jgi:polyvinyl alcohol dehydrogenase (cytochrome)
MRRRDFIAIIAGIAALPLAAHAQQAVPSIAQTASTDISKCAQNPVGFPQRLDGPRWNGWGADLSNSRFQPAAMAGLTQDQVPLLQLKWAFGFLGRSAAVAQPSIVGGLVFVGGGDREVYPNQQRN